jgi:hypothetical protein
MGSKTEAPYDERPGVEAGDPADVAVVDARPHVVEDLVVSARIVDEVALLGEVELIVQLGLVVPLADLGTDLGAPQGQGFEHVAPPGRSSPWIVFTSSDRALCVSSSYMKLSISENRSFPFFRSGLGSGPFL